MEQFLEQTEFLFNQILTDSEKALIIKLVKEINEAGADYSLNELWEYDSYLGGIGGYSMPSDPVKNPFKGGYTRELFRPIQYARSNMETLDINYTSRHVIRDCGLHLEFILKFVLKKSSRLNALSNRNATLGKLAHILLKRKLIKEELFSTLKKIIVVYNKSKHEVNQNVNRKRLFSPGDALIFYVVTRKIANKVLQLFYDDIYKDMRNLNILQRFHINSDNQHNFGYLK